jgi:hypothetical protein
MNPLTQSKNAIILPVLIALTLGCVALSPQARAVCQEGCLTGDNTVLGEGALISNTTGFANTAIGVYALHYNTTGLSNTAVGFQALILNTTGVWNTAIGYQALDGNTTANGNTAIGFVSLGENTTGESNTGVGNTALGQNTTGNDNTAIGVAALLNNTTGYNNVAEGSDALLFNNTGTNNVAIGVNALFNNTGSNNIGLGHSAGRNLTTGSNNIYIGNLGVASESGKIRIGKIGTQNATFIAGISGVTVPDGVGVIVGNNGQLGTSTSSARFKDNIKPMDKASEAILALKPVTFHYKHELDPESIPQFGLVAEEVEKINPDLVARDEQGKPYSVRYEAVNAMLLNEFLKEHRTVQDLKLTVVEQQKQIEALTAGLQKVNAQLELRKPATQTVLNNR